MTTTPLTAENRAELRRLDPTGPRVDQKRLARAVTPLLDMLDSVERERDETAGPHCTGCGNAIDPECCWCGDGPSDKHYDETHGFIPMGCDCCRDPRDRDWKRAANELRMRLWQANAQLATANMELRCAQIQVEDRGRSFTEVTAQLATATAKLAAYEPRDDELDSIISLLNWTRLHHDSDSSARLWLERVVAACLALPAPSKGVPDGE